MIRRTRARIPSLVFWFFFTVACAGTVVAVFSLFVSAGVR